MATDPKHQPIGKHVNSDKAVPPDRKGGSAEQNAREWGGGSKAARGAVSKSGKHNENSTSKS